MNISPGRKQQMVKVLPKFGAILLNELNTLYICLEVIVVHIVMIYIHTIINRSFGNNLSQMANFQNRDMVMHLPLWQAKW